MTGRVKAVVLTSTAPRHRYFASVMARHFDVRAVLNQPKKTYYDAQAADSAAIREHFLRNKDAELDEFGMPDFSPMPIDVDDINSEAAAAHAEGADVVLLFGTAILGAVWLKRFPGRIVNLHLGLSPYYRGSATLFWPFANEDLSGLGTTIHLAVARVDAGNILRRRRAMPRVGDSYYTLTNRLIRESIDAVPEMALAYFEGRLVPMVQEGAVQKAYRKADFDENALSRALAFVGAGLTQEQIDAAARNDRCPFSQ